MLTIFNLKKSSACSLLQTVKAIAAVAYTPGGADKLMVEEVEVAPPKAHEVRLKVIVTASLILILF